jgi:hypothetical protein
LIATVGGLESADAEPGLVRLVWLAPNAVELNATVERRDDSSDWSALGRIAGNGDGTLAYDDRAVEPAHRYGYRLAIVTSGGVQHTSETWVTVPGHAMLSLAGAQSTPVSGDVALTFSLPDGAPATLELMDLAGRRVWSREVGAMGAGSHTVRVDEAAGLPSGIYLARLTRQAQSLRAKLAIVR